MNCQQLQLYLAEGSVPVGDAIPPSSLQAYADSLREFDWWQRNFPMVWRIEAYERPVGFKGGSMGAWKPAQGAGLIELVPVHMNQLFILHEVAHVLAAARYGSRAHDPWFARTYLEAVGTYLGPDVFKPLYDSFVEAGIDFEHQSSVPGGVQL